MLVKIILSMELSILQHAKDKAPRQVTLDEMVRQIRGDQWPTGYEPLVVIGAVVAGGLQKKNVRWLTERITTETELPPMQPLFRMFDVPCFYRGELVADCGKAKSGKTYFLSILMAASLTQKALALERITNTNLTNLTNNAVDENSCNPCNSCSNKENKNKVFII